LEQGDGAWRANTICTVSVGDLRKTILAALHIPLILFVPWTTRWIPALAIAAIDSADLIVIITILAFVEKVMAKRRLSGARRKTKV
jgi:hypothetical protein